MSRALLGLLVAATLLGLGCETMPTRASAGAQRDSAPFPRIYRGGSILTMAGDTPERVEAVVEYDGWIVHAGDADAASRVAAGLDGGPAEIVELDGRALLPGFFDPHVHYGVQTLALDFDVVEPWRFDSPDAFVDHVAEIAADTPAGEWIVVFGYDRVLIPPFRNLTRQDLDRATRDHPVVVLYLGLHWATANSRGLEAAGIDRSTPTRIPGGGIFFKDDAGEPTGLMTESAVFGVVEHLGEAVDPMAVDARFEIARRMSANGITTIADRASGATGGPAELALLESLAADPAYPLRIVATPIYQILPALEGPRPWNGQYQATQIKLLIDASLVGGTSATLEPQFDGTRGHLNYTDETYRRALREATSLGFGTATHTMGDRGHAALLDAFEALRDEVLPVGLHSIEHSALVAPEDHARIADLGLSVSHLTPLLRVHGDAMAARVYGETRSARLFDAASALDAGINLALHSDAPVFEARPLHAVSVAVNRRTTGGQVRGPGARITPYQALFAVTLGSARHLGLDHELGSLEAGKRADFVLLDQDPLTTAPDAIDSIHVDATIKAGQRTFDRAAR